MAKCIQKEAEKTLFRRNLGLIRKIRSIQEIQVTKIGFLTSVCSQYFSTPDEGGGIGQTDLF
jgi:hypothetical protein